MPLSQAGSLTLYKQFRKLPPNPLYFTLPSIPTTHTLGFGPSHAACLISLSSQTLTHFHSFSYPLGSFSELLAPPSQHSGPVCCWVFVPSHPHHSFSRCFPPTHQACLLFSHFALFIHQQTRILGFLINSSWPEHLWMTHTHKLWDSPIAHGCYNHRDGSGYSHRLQRLQLYVLGSHGSQGTEQTWPSKWDLNEHSTEAFVHRAHSVQDIRTNQLWCIAWCYSDWIIWIQRCQDFKNYH